MHSLPWQGNGLVLNISIRNTDKTESQTVKIVGSIDYFTGLGVGASGRALGPNKKAQFLPRLCGLANSTRAILAGQTSGHLANSTLAGLVPYFGARSPAAIPSWSNSVGLNSPYPMQGEVNTEPSCVCVRVLEYVGLITMTKLHAHIHAYTLMHVGPCSRVSAANLRASVAGHRGRG